jgi:3-oxoacyl-[acyl-carrier protein] reductase
LQVNATGSFLVARAALERLEDGGRLILLASRAGERGGAGQGAYSASKAAVIALAKTAACEGAVRGIAVNAVCPGFAPSQLSASLSPSRLEELQGQSLLQPFDAAVQLSSTIRWLLSDGAVGITGQVIHCDGRLSL